jgi:K+/H+ antiporter YhaU regulatory subunit KhtT
LRQNSAARIAADTRYQAFIRQIELYRTIRNRRTITLNEEARYELYRQERAVVREAESLLEDDNSGSRSNDVVLAEAMNIAADLSRMTAERPAQRRKQK